MGCQRISLTNQPNRSQLPRHQPRHIRRQHLAKGQILHFRLVVVIFYGHEERRYSQDVATARLYTLNIESFGAMDLTMEPEKYIPGPSTHFPVFCSMARSEEAIRRRAEKRNKSVAEQRRADFTDAKKGKERQAAKEAKARGGAAPIVAPPKAATTPASPSKPPKDGNTANTTKRTVTPPRKKTNKSAKHKIKRGGAGNSKKPQTAPAANQWAKQATPEQIERNATLRKQYLETNGEGMSEEDVQRAKALILRDERKKAKKAERAKMKLENAAAAKKKKDESSKSKSSKKKEKQKHKKEKPESVDAKIEQQDERPLAASTSTSISTQPRQKKPTPLDLAWRQVAIDEKEGRIPEYVAETETEKKLERIAESNRKSRAELAKIRALLAGNSKDIDAGLEAVGRYATSGSSSGSESATSSDADDENSGIQASSSDVTSAMKKILAKNEKKAHKKAMKYKKLTKKIQKRLKISDSKKDELKKMLERIGKQSDDFKVDGKVISLK